MERFEIFTICRRPPVLQTDASVGMMKIVVCETEARKGFGAADFHTPITRYRNIVAGGCAWQYMGLCWPYLRAKSKAIRALESAYNRYPHLHWALWENRKYHNCGPGQARTIIIFTPE